MCRCGRRRCCRHSGRHRRRGRRRRPATCPLPPGSDRARMPGRRPPPRRPRGHCGGGRRRSSPRRGLPPATMACAGAVRPRGPPAEAEGRGWGMRECRSQKGGAQSGQSCRSFREDVMRLLLPWPGLEDEEQDDQSGDGHDHIGGQRACEHTWGGERPDHLAERLSAHRRPSPLLKGPVLRGRTVSPGGGPRATMQCCWPRAFRHRKGGSTAVVYGERVR